MVRDGGTGDPAVDRGSPPELSDAAPLTPRTAGDDGQRLQNLATDLGLAVEARNRMAGAVERERDENRGLRAALEILGWRGEPPAHVAAAWVTRAADLESALQVMRAQRDAVASIARLWKLAKLGRGPVSLDDVERALMALADMNEGAKR